MDCVWHGNVVGLEELAMSMERRPDALGASRGVEGGTPVAAEVGTSIVEGRGAPWPPWLSGK
jgi:hypothetical protein